MSLSYPSFSWAPRFKRVPFFPPCHFNTATSVNYGFSSRCYGPNTDTRTETFAESSGLWHIKCGRNKHKLRHPPSLICHMVLINCHAVAVVLGGYLTPFRILLWAWPTKGRDAVAFSPAKKTNIWVSLKVTPLVCEDMTKRAACEDQAFSNSCR